MILIQKLGAKSPNIIQFTIFVLALSLLSIILSIALTSDSMFPYLIPSILLVLLVLKRPILGFYFYFFILMLVPYWIRITPYTILNSPLDIIALSTIGIGIVYFILKGKQLHLDKLIITFSISVIIIFIHVIAQHGPSSFQLLYRLVQGSIPLMLIILLVDNPRHIRNILIAGIISVMAFVILWLPFMITYFFSPWLEEY